MRAMSGMKADLIDGLLDRFEAEGIIEVSSTKGKSNSLGGRPTAVYRLSNRR